MADPILKPAGLRAGYGAGRALRGLDLSVARGERIAIIGRNGAGKTALLAAIMGLTRLLRGEPLKGLAPVICEQLMAAFDEIAADGRTVVQVRAACRRRPALRRPRGVDGGVRDRA